MANVSETRKTAGIGKGTPGPGRPKGTTDKITRDVKGLILDALGEVGGKRYLVQQARKNPKAFLALLGRLVPQEVKAEFNGSVTVEHLGLSEVRDRTEFLLKQGTDSAPAVAPLH